MRYALPTIGAAALLATQLLAAADAVRFSAALGFVRDDNLLRAPSDEEARAALGVTRESETIRRVQVGVEGKIKPGRQTFTGKASVNDNRYNKFHELNHYGWDAEGRWDWQAGNNWSGEVGFSNNRQINNFTELRVPKKDLVTRQRAHASAAYQFHPDWQILGGVAREDLKHSDSGQRVFNRKEDSIDIGLRYTTKAGNSITLQAKGISGKPEPRDLGTGTLANNEYRQTELNVLSEWALTGHTRLSTRLGYARRRYEEFSSRDFSGIAGRATLTWSPTDKTDIAVSAWRELEPVEDLTASDALSRGWSISPAWRATEKITVQGFLARQKRDHEGAGRTSIDQRKDKLQTAGIGITYRPLKNTELSLSYQTEKRDSNLTLDEYKANTISLGIRAEF
jgi:exopolysaccharide biosynthesis operon protein EpsL